MKGLKTAATLNDRFVKKLAAFVGEDNDDDVLDGRVTPKMKKKRKSKQLKVCLGLQSKNVEILQYQSFSGFLIYTYLL